MEHPTPHPNYQINIIDLISALMSVMSLGLLIQGKICCEKLILLMVMMRMRRRMVMMRMLMLIATITSTVFATVSGDGRVTVFDLCTDKYTPVCR